MYVVYRVYDTEHKEPIAYAQDATEAAIIAENDKKDSKECNNYLITREGEECTTACLSL